MDKNTAARRFMFGWHLRIDPNQGEAVWTNEEGERETVPYLDAARVLSSLSDDLEIKLEEDGVREYYFRDDEDDETEA